MGRINYKPNKEKHGKRVKIISYGAHSNLKGLPYYNITFEDGNEKGHTNEEYLKADYKWEEL